MQQFAQFQAINAMENMSERPGSSNTMMDAGLGMAMGGVMGGMMGSAMGNQHMGGQQMAPPPPAAPTFHYNGPSGQAQLGPQQIAQRVAADRQGNHTVWAAGWPGWRSWRDVPEIAGLVPPAAAPPPAAPPPTAVQFHYHGPDGQAQLGVAEIASKIKAAPEANHQLWKDGFDGWRSWKDVPEVASAVNAGGPPPPPSGGPPPPPPGK